ncbi:MAG: YkvS family protein [Bacillaceae bacterium]|uniref:Uncharacterized protein n=3 Tax=Bacillaceae TaxID=186817 RepID=A0A0B0IAI3_9BACI|nr:MULTISPECIES: DUF2187 family protein [Halalkalibacter]KHF38280.1 hypothetical protein LQ50_22090 [Halalkalibacter okhensis]MDX5476177.1 YkvS family protein [Bacillaceae bacterium]GAE37569.1 hypothetical protein JCM9157_4880 [Halalkalibacter akibai JCM 9157]
MYNKSKKINPNAAEVNEIILYDGIELTVIAVYNNSVVAEFITYPVCGREDEFPFERTCINHRNYQRTFETI